MGIIYCPKDKNIMIFKQDGLTCEKCSYVMKYAENRFDIEGSVKGIISDKNALIKIMSDTLSKETKEYTAETISIKKAVDCK